MSKPETKKRTSPSVERQLALALIALIEAAGDLFTAPEGDRSGAGLDRSNAFNASVASARELLKANNYDSLESIPTRVKRIETAIKDAMDAGEWGKIGKFSADMIRAKKGLPPPAIEKRPRASSKPNTPKPKGGEKRSRKKKDEGTGDLVLHGDGNLGSLTESPDEEAEWLTRHPEPKEN